MHGTKVVYFSHTATNWQGSQTTGWSSDSRPDRGEHSCISGSHTAPFPPVVDCFDLMNDAAFLDQYGSRTPVLQNIMRTLPRPKQYTVRKVFGAKTIPLRSHIHTPLACWGRWQQSSTCETQGDNEWSFVGGPCRHDFVHNPLSSWRCIVFSNPPRESPRYRLHCIRTNG